MKNLACAWLPKFISRTGDRTLGKFNLSQVDLFTNLSRVGGMVKKRNI